MYTCRTDLPRYKVYEDGIEGKEATDLLGYGDKMKDFVFFYLGCSFSFDLALLQAKIPMRYLEQSCNVSIYTVSTPCVICHHKMSVKLPDCIRRYSLLNMTQQ